MREDERELTAVRARSGGEPLGQAVPLPHADRFFEIRFESIGGLGAHAAGQILATAAVLRMGLNGAHFSSYGSEKKGSLVRSFVRLGATDRPIRTSAPVEAPDAIVVFHAALLRNPATFAGLRKDGTFIYNAPSRHRPGGTRGAAAHGAGDPRRCSGDRGERAIPAQCGAARHAVRGRSPFSTPHEVLEALSEEFAGKHPEAVASNERAFRRGATDFEKLEGVGRAEGDLPVARAEPAWGYETQPIGGHHPRAGQHGVE